MIGSAYCTVPLTLMYRIRYLPTLPLPGLAPVCRISVVIGPDPASSQSYCTVPLTLMYRIRYLPTLPLPGLAELWKTCPPDVTEMAMIWQLSKMKFIHFWYSSKR